MYIKVTIKYLTIGIFLCFIFNSINCNFSRNTKKKEYTDNNIEIDVIAKISNDLIGHIAKKYYNFDKKRIIHVHLNKIQSNYVEEPLFSDYLYLRVFQKLEKANQIDLYPYANATYDATASMHIIKQSANKLKVELTCSDFTSRKTFYSDSRIYETLDFDLIDYGNFKKQPKAELSKIKRLDPNKPSKEKGASNRINGSQKQKSVKIQYDKYGRPIYDAKGRHITYPYQILAKRCLSCNRSIPLETRGGETCPYCGAVWTWPESTKIKELLAEFGPQASEKRKSFRQKKKKAIPWRPASGKWTGDGICFSVSKNGLSLSLMPDSCKDDNGDAKSFYHSIKLNTSKASSFEISLTKDIPIKNYSFSVGGGELYQLNGSFKSRYVAEGEYRFDLLGDIQTGRWKAYRANH